MVTEKENIFRRYLEDMASKDQHRYFSGWFIAKCQEALRVADHIPTPASCPSCGTALVNLSKERIGCPKCNKSIQITWC